MIRRIWEAILLWVREHKFLATSAVLMIAMIAFLVRRLLN